MSFLLTTHGAASAPWAAPPGTLRCSLLDKDKELERQPTTTMGDKLAATIII